MYHPYLRGKQFELLAIRNSLEKIAQANITPIIEPVRISSRDIVRCVNELINVNANYIVVVNPQFGELANNMRSSDTLFSELIDTDPDIELGFIVTENTTLAELTLFKQKYHSQRFSLIHFGEFVDEQDLIDAILNDSNFNKHVFIEHTNSSAYRSRFNRMNRVLIRDSFNKKPRNIDYIHQLTEYFSDLFNTYQTQGYNGFGDFLIVGDHYADGGGQAITAAIHITYEHNGESVYIQHFLSEERIAAEEVQILIEEALTRFVEFINDNPHIRNWSTSCNELLRIYDEGSNTNLAMIKKLSICHHLELMHYLTTS